MVDIKVFLNAGVSDILLYLYEHPEGRQKIDMRKDLLIAPNTQVRAHNILLEHKLIMPIADPEKLLFVLTDLGKSLAEEIKKIIAL